jgi:hypothetical protein
MSDYRDNPGAGRGDRSRLGWLAALLAILVMVGLVWWVGGDRHGTSGSPTATPATVPSEGQTPAGRTTR